MNENVSIKEGNITRKFAPIDKLKVDNTDGTSSIWVPEDDLKTGVLYASENGIYIASEDGYDAYSEVVIRVEKRIDDGDLIDESGMDWKDIDFDGDVGNFDELDNWDVDTLEDFSDDLEGFDDLFNDKDFWDEEKEKPITEDEMGDFDGDSLSGIDPETGKPVEYSVDEDGFLDEEDLPWRIEITRLPERTEFYDGHRIVFSGIEVCSVTDIDGEDVYKPIPYNELIFPVTIAEGEESGDGVYTNMEGLNCLHVTFSEEFRIRGWYTFYLGPAVGSHNDGVLYAACLIPGTAYITRYNDKLYGYGISIAAASFAGVTKDPKGHGFTGGTFAIQRWARLGDNDPASSMSFPVSSVDPMTIDDMSNLTKIMEVPVQWIRPDGEMLETQYNIKVLPNPSGV